ncbi:MAG: hypothetical protein JSS82_03455 [Bacteroidetes bacterium]|nr:hypothetical protein [Bacteroidota bacterium]
MQYVHAGYDLDLIHVLLLKENCCAVLSGVVNSLRHDVRAVFYVLSRGFFIIDNVIERSVAYCAELRREAIINITNTMLPAMVGFFMERSDYENIYSVNKAPYASRYFQEPATEMMSRIIDFHNDLMVVLIFISVFIVVLLVTCLVNYSTASLKEFYFSPLPVSRVSHDPLAEVVFTVFPALIIYTIAAPSFVLLYTNNEWLDEDVELTVSVTGHQWYWNYEYSLDRIYFKNEMM